MIKTCEICYNVLVSYSTIFFKIWKIKFVYFYQKFYVEEESQKKREAPKISHLSMHLLKPLHLKLHLRFRLIIPG